SSVAAGTTRAAPPMSPDLVAPALREAGTSAEAIAPATLDAQVLQALSHAQPAPELPPRGRGNAAAPASTPATAPKGGKEAKPGNKPAPKQAPKPAQAAP
ncbi:MAG: penicillin-binding protein 2, partial [Betaproteobacteria bacterium]|nr:penicillin-binding protein 2 [Betaproteobacteria bacterium]